MEIFTELESQFGKQSLWSVLSGSYLQEISLPGWTTEIYLPKQDAELNMFLLPLPKFKERKKKK